MRWFVGISIIVAAILFYQNEFGQEPAATAHKTTSSSQAAGADAILPEDLNAHFSAFKSPSRDPFLPEVFPPNSGGQGDLSGVGKKGGWSLTGINEVNGVRSALVEDDSTGDSVFLQPGDHWNGLKVIAITDDGVQLENTIGQETRLTFPVPADDSTTVTTTTATNPTSAVPGINQISPLPPMPGGGPGGPFGSN
jgi:hypothetical protein